MSDSKSSYSSGVAAQTALAKLDSSLSKKLARAAERAAKFHANWKAVNLNDFIGRFAPGSHANMEGSKITFQTPGSNLRVICDVRGGYCRLQDTSITPERRSYLDINGHNANNKRLPSGKQTGRTQAEYNEVTHFRILKREEM